MPLHDPLRRPAAKFAILLFLLVAGLSLLIFRSARQSTGVESGSGAKVTSPASPGSVGKAGGASIPASGLTSDLGTNEPPVTSFRIRPSRHREGSGAWFEAAILLPLIQDIDSLDPDGRTGAALAFLRGCVGRIPRTFEDRMIQAAALRLIPYSIRGNPDLAAAGTAVLANAFISDDTPTYSRMAAVAALFGLDLSYDVRPISSATAATDQQREIYSATVQSAGPSSRPDGLHLRVHALGNEGLRVSCRQTLRTGRDEGLVDALCLALSFAPSPEDQGALSEALLANGDLYRGTKSHVIQAIVDHPTSGTVSLLAAGAASADAKGDKTLAYLYREGLVNAGQNVVELVEECRKDLDSGASVRDFSKSIDLLCKMHAKSGSPQSGIILEQILTDPATPLARRTIVLRRIVENRNVRVLPLLRDLHARELDPNLKDNLGAALLQLSGK